MKEKLAKRSLNEKIALLICFAVFFIYAISLLFPFLWIGYNSLKVNGYQDFVLDVWGLPKDPLNGLKNYLNVFNLNWSGYSFLDMVFNTFEYVAIVTFVGILFPLQTAYVVSKYRFKLKKVYYAIAIMTISVPIVGGLASMIILLSRLGLYNSYLGIYLMAATGFGGSFLLFYSYFVNMSWSYAEAAFIDGAGHFKVFIKVYLPMSVPIIVAVGVLSFLGSWNDFFNVYMYASERPTLAVGIEFIGKTMMSQMKYPQLFAFMMISMIPSLIVFALFQNLIMGNISIGGIKG